MKRLFQHLLFGLLMFFGCERFGGIPELYLYTDLLIENGSYIFDYPDNHENTSTIVYGETEPNTRVYWSSPDSFIVNQEGGPTTTCIIDDLTYSDNETGITQQLINLSAQHIGDTVTIIGLVYGKDFSDDGYNNDTLSIIIND